MRGLIYKEFSVFYKCMDKRMVAMIIGVVGLLLYLTGSYGGLIASIFFAINIGTQNVMTLVSDEKARWKKYQMAMPLSDFSVVASKYVAVIYTLGISLLGSVIFNCFASVVFQSFEAAVWGLAISAAVLLPMMFTGICLPLAYWFGVQSAQAMGIVVLIPIFYLVKYFEDGAGFSVMAGSLVSYVAVFGVVTVAVFVISIGISTVGYARKK